MGQVRWAIGAVCLTSAALAAPGCSGRAPLARTAAPAELALVVGAERESAEREAAELLQRFAPSFAQETSRAHPERDRPLRIDFDGDWDATNNWENLDPRHATARAAAYGSAILTATHAYLTYTLFYPRDWATPVCLPYICHDNDLEVALVVVERAPGGSGDGARLVLVETKAHNSYHRLAGSAVARNAAGGPRIAIESQGHGMTPMRVDAPIDRARLVPFEPPSLGGRDAYELLSLREALWARRSAEAERGTLWIEGESGYLSYTGGRYGRRGRVLGVSMASKQYPGGVRPPWGLRADAGERGDWFLDPAFVTLEKHPDLFAEMAPSRDYVLNPYLEDLALECSEADCSRPSSTAAPPAAL